MAKWGQRKVPSMTKSDLIVTNTAISVNKSAFSVQKVPFQSKKVPFQSVDKCPSEDWPPLPFGPSGAAGWTNLLPFFGPVYPAFFNKTKITQVNGLDKIPTP